MADGSEPEVNIGSGARHPFSEAVSEPSSRAEAVVDRLGELYWRRSYGGKDAFACLVRTILSQNASDAASQPAFDALCERFAADSFARNLRDADPELIAATIEPAGLYNQKTDVIQSAAERVLTEFDDTATFDEYVATAPDKDVREALLAFDGVGPKTADCVLLFAGGRPGVFPVDTHVYRIARRLGIAPATGDHEAVRDALEAGHIPATKCGFGHTAMIQFGREYCTARQPACLDEPSACPLADLCDQVGIDTETGTVRDPATIPSDGS